LSVGGSTKSKIERREMQVERTDYFGNMRRGGKTRPWTIDISQYRLLFGFSLLNTDVFHLNCLTAQLSYEGRAAVEGGQIVFLNVTTII
jgi:hypothetical protein